MYATADWSVTPRPMYPADGRKLPDIYTQPAELRDELNRELGQFPLFHFWGPTADIESTRWIGDCALHVFGHAAADADARLPAAPRLQPAAPRAGDSAHRARRCRRRRGLRRADRRGTPTRMPRSSCCRSTASPRSTGRCTSTACCARRACSRCARSWAASSSTRAPPRPSPWPIIRSRTSTSRARSASPEVAQLLRALPGVERVLDAEGKRGLGLDHPRSGELVAIADARSLVHLLLGWTTTAAPDFARTVDIHRKPGYDPVELFVDPALRLPKLRIAARLAQKVLGFRYLMDVIPLDASLVRARTGAPPTAPTTARCSSPRGPSCSVPAPWPPSMSRTCCSRTYSVRRQHSRGAPHEAGRTARIVAGDSSAGPGRAPGFVRQWRGSGRERPSATCTWS